MIHLTDIADADEHDAENNDEWTLLVHESKVLRQSDKAIFVRTDAGDVWVPKSRCCIGASDRMLYVKTWFAKKEAIA